VLPAVEERSIPTAAMLAEAHPAALAGDTLTLEFSPEAAFHRRQAEEPKHATVLQDALYEVTGRRLALELVLGEERHRPGETEEDRPVTEAEIVELVKSTFDAQEVEQ
jgi:hypothetical protein